MNNTLELAQAQPMAVARPMNPADLMQSMVASGITADNVSAFTELVKLAEHMEDRTAKREFAAAFIELQKELPTIEGFRPIPDKHGNVKFRYANFDDIDEIVRPICLRHGFSYAFHETRKEGNSVTVTMTLQHAGGHFREVPYTVRIGAGPPNAGESQADISGHSYAQRGAIESGLSLRVVGATDDARMEGSKITQEQADELAHRVQMTNSNSEAFLKFAGAASFAEILSGKYPILDEFLRRKEKGRA